MSYHMAEKNPKKMRIPNDYLSGSDSSEEETSQHLCTSQEERLYHTVKGSAQANASGTSTYYGTVQPHSQKRTSKMTKDKETP